MALCICTVFPFRIPHALAIRDILSRDIRALSP